MLGSDLKLSEAQVQLSRIVDQLETVHWQLVGLALSLPASPTESHQEASGEKTTAEAKLRNIIECVLADRILFALEDIRSALTRTEGEERSPG
jgi:hypothetical protein